MKGRTILTILCGIGGLAASILILAGGRSLIHGGTFADGLREFWNWAIAAMAGVSCGYSYWYNETKKKDKDEIQSARLPIGETACFIWLPGASARSPLKRSHRLLFRALRTLI